MVTDRPLTDRPRADKQRNRARLLAAASVLVARDGDAVSLEEIAREAGVGSATLHRHFGSRRELLGAVFHDRVMQVCARADAMADAPDAGAALVGWLGELAVYVARNRGLARTLLAEPDGALPREDTCDGMLREAGAGLLNRAIGADAVREDVLIDDLLTLVNAISLVTEADPASADRLVRLAAGGLAPC